MNAAQMAGIIDAMMKVAVWTPPPGSRIKPSTSQYAEKLRGHEARFGTPQPIAAEVTKTKGMRAPDLANAPTQVKTKKAPAGLQYAGEVLAKHGPPKKPSSGQSGLSHSVFRKAKEMAESHPDTKVRKGIGAMLKEHAARGGKVNKPKSGLSPDKLRAAMEKARSDPGGKMHRLLAARAKLKAAEGKS